MCRYLSDFLGCGRLLRVIRQSANGDGCGRLYEAIRQSAAETDAVGYFKAIRQSAIGRRHSADRKRKANQPIEKESRWWATTRTPERLGAKVVLFLEDITCNRNIVELVLAPGYKQVPLDIAKNTQQYNQKLASAPPFRVPFSRVVEFFERNHRSVDLRKFRQPRYHVQYHAVDLDYGASSLVQPDWMAVRQASA